MKHSVIEFGGYLSLGGTEKAMQQWSYALQSRGVPVQVAAISRGLRATELIENGIPIISVGDSCSNISEIKPKTTPYVLHMHSSGEEFIGDNLSRSLKKRDGNNCKIISTNIFGKLDNPKEAEWTDFRLFISWTSCVQAARRAGRKLDLDFFRRQSVAVYPVRDLFNSPAYKYDTKQMERDIRSQRETLGILPEHILFGRFSRPEPNKWTPLVLEAFLAAWKVNPSVRLLLREPPAIVVDELLSKRLAVLLSESSVMRHSLNAPVVILSATADSKELAISQMACDVILHTSSIGESFGYGIAEPMAMGKPVIANSVPWHDQAQIELVRHGECGLIASTISSMKAAILQMASKREPISNSPSSKYIFSEMAQNARSHILALADLDESTDRIEMAMRCAIENEDNPFAEQDLEKALQTAAYLDEHQWGHSFEEQLSLRTTNFKVWLYRWQRKLRDQFEINRRANIYAPA